MSIPTFSPVARFFLALAVVLSGAVAIAGCDMAGSSASSDGDAQLTVLLTDAPGDILKAHVTIERVAIVPSDDTTEGDAETGGIEVLSEDSLAVDLVQLQDGVTETLGELDIPAGSYSQIRLVTAREATVYYEGEDGTAQEAALKLPSADETGIKVNFDELTVDESTNAAEITLDFNVEDSFVKAGQSGTYIFKPVVHAQSVVADGDPIESDDSESDDN